MLLLSVYKLVDLCSVHTVPRQLNAVLSAGARHVMRHVYAEYTQYYQYSRHGAPDDYIHCLYTG